MKILLLGSGGREHALAWKLAQSQKTEALYIAPGNAGTAAHGTNINLNPEDFDAVGKFAIVNEIDLLVVGPEAPLVAGITDYFLADETLKSIPVIGPSKAGALLEGSKDFAKAFMQKHQIPTAAYQSFTAETVEAGCAFLETLNAPYVLKADGLAAGKGVLILDSLEEAKTELRAMLTQAKFGTASAKVVIEEFLDGIELSVFVLTDGTNYQILPEAKDYKRIGEGDTGPNTGGMGSISPVPFANSDFLKKVEDQVIRPTIAGLKKDQIHYKGFIFLGLMNIKGNPFVIEYNVRMGDPETESVMPRIKSDLTDLLQATAEERLGEFKIELDPRFAASVMLVSGGYPNAYEKGKVIKGLDQIQQSILFHAGTKRNAEDQIATNGGRVIAITSYGDTLQEALDKAYQSAAKIKFEGCYYRKDLGQDLI